jgi:glycosyltransferase involved in cell wall biosynthesis
VNDEEMKMEAAAAEKPASTAAWRPRVLLIAEAANPEWPSVPLVGWSQARALSRVADVHLVTQVRNIEAIRRFGLAEDAFTAIDSEAVARPLYNVSTLLRGGAGKGWTTVAAFSALAYPYFEHLVWKRFASRLRLGHFDLVHRITPLSPTVPSLLAARVAKLRLPFVVGPLNGGIAWPPSFGAVRRREREWLSYVRRAYRWLPWYRSTRKNAAAIIAGSRSTYAEVPARYHSKCIYIPENAVDENRLGRVTTLRAGSPLRLAFIGRLVPYKCADVVVEAAAPLLQRGLVRLDVIGDGPEMPRLRQLVHRLGVEGSVHLHGWIAHQLVQDHLADSDVFVFPSVREFGGAVVLEAMASGVVPIVVDYGGPSELTTPYTGYIVPMGNREQLVERVRERLERIVADPSPLAGMSRRARDRVSKYFTWDRKADQVLEVYRWVCGGRPDKPDFGMPFPDPVADVS